MNIYIYIYIYTYIHTYITRSQFGSSPASSREFGSSPSSGKVADANPSAHVWHLLGGNLSSPKPGHLRYHLTDVLLRESETRNSLNLGNEDYRPNGQRPALRDLPL